MAEEGDAATGGCLGPPFEAFGGRRRVAGPSPRSGLANPQALAVGIGTIRWSTSSGSTRMTRGPLREAARWPLAIRPRRVRMLSPVRRLRIGSLGRCAPPRHQAEDHPQVLIIAHVVQVSGPARE